MRDVRVGRWSQLLVEYSLEAKKGQRVCIFGAVGAMPLIEAVYEKLLACGAYVECVLHEDKMQEILFSTASAEQLKTPSIMKEFVAENFDLLLFIHAHGNCSALANFDPAKQVMVSGANSGFLNSVMKRSANGDLRWCRTDFPTMTAAQRSSMGTGEYEEFAFRAGYLDEPDFIERWRTLDHQQQVAIKYLTKKKTLHFTTEAGTDLFVDVEGMIWENCSGKINFPDGEIFTGPNLSNDGGITGVVRHCLPTVYRNVEVEGIELVFEKGVVVESKATKNEAFLKAMIDVDAGASRVGEVAFGTNYRVDRGTKDILFDEKIGGTFHIALGKGYPQTGNSNMSALHWDIVTDLREGGKVFADDELILENGQFLKEGWPGQ